MRVAFNARLLTGPQLRGWNRYTINLLAHLPALGVELFLYSDGPLHAAPPGPPARRQLESHCGPGPTLDAVERIYEQIVSGEPGRVSAGSFGQSTPGAAATGLAVPSRRSR